MDCTPPAQHTRPEWSKLAALPVSAIAAEGFGVDGVHGDSHAGVRNDSQASLGACLILGH